MKLLLSALALATTAGLGLARLSPAAASGLPAALDPAPAAQTFEVDAAHSSVVFRTMHLGVSHFFGHFKAVTGKIEYDAENPSKSSVTIEIPTDSLDTNNANRDQHLASPDFFSAKEFPKILFESQSVKKKGDGLEVKGQLTVRDVTKELTVQVTKVGEGDSPFGDHRAGWDTEFQFDMREFGFSFVQQQPGAVGPTVDVWVALETVRK